MPQLGRVSLLILAALLLALQYQLWLSPQGMREVMRLRGEIEAQAAENAERERRNALLAAEVADLRSGLEAIEERARSELGMIGEHETFYRTARPGRELRRREPAAREP